MVCQTALHDVEAVAGAGPDGRQPLAGRAPHHLCQRVHAPVSRRDLQDLRQDLFPLDERLGEGSGCDETSPELETQLLRDVAEGLELLHVLAHALEVTETLRFRELKLQGLGS